ncbi:oxidoreductase [Haematobacter missouriensis]|uniref:NAD(P)-dependent oxidoreductase n=1 Tax=Haematobacter missouriensis TaxID=366616 RepID=A0A212AWQ6_9RHOB|nr:SDR family oxidoreductase [Haematobacter missouriensis]KFI33923.1 oxidoreductase [Haematobacter missouriensis]OWJ71307.1 NAD(P)-dependent oxidoreductase [Haematobacter missouriensis]OWJ85917.1 NAD(P)-dependent oxidoreductase [Haematobacter missouriensis]
MLKVALVTGGSRGIGSAIAEDLQRDHKVVITWRTTAPEGLPPDIIAIHADLAEPDAALRVVTEVIAQLGRLDVIVNNAGVVRHSPKERFDAAAEMAILAVNLLAPQALLAAALPHLKPGSAIVNISSVNAVLPPRDASTYGGSKAALNLWTRAMAKELGGNGIRVNAVAPGAVNTPEQPRSEELTGLFVQETALGRMGEPRDIARAVRFLASDQSGFITGEVLTVSGGYRL